MSQSPSSIPKTASSSNFNVIFEKALQAYQKTTKQDLTVHPLASQLQACDSPAAILTILQGQVDQFIQSRSGNERLRSWLNPTISVLYAFSATIGDGVSLVFSPAKTILSGVGVLLLAAKDVEASQDVLIDIFERIENFFRRLEIYVDVPPTPAMTDMMVKIMVEVLDILGTATKEMKQSRAKIFLKKVAGIRKLEDGLKRLDKMTNDEARMASAEVLKVAHNIDKKVEGVDEKVQSVGAQVQDVDKKVEVVEAKVQMVVDGAQQTAQSLDDEKRRQLRERLRKWQSPTDPSTNHEIACECQHEGTAKWFYQGSVFEEWKVAGSLLWIHGKPGSGKSILCSAIIQDIATLYDAGSATMAYFYFDFRNIDKRSRRNLLTSLLVQLSARSDPFCDILSRLYETHDDGARQPSDSALVHCLKEMLTLPDQAPIYIILDALDECPNTSGVPSSREQVLDLVKELVGLRHPRLHICVTSRAEVDIQDALQNLVSHSVSLHDESGQKQDIAEYVRSVVHSNSIRAIRRWRDADRDLVIETLSERADGMFRWVFCQLETLRHCLPQNIPRILKELPTSLDETYERVLREIGTANQRHAYRLLQCLTVATRPLDVVELAEILALDFDGAKEGIPELKKDWRWKDQQEAVLSTCSSLIAVVGDGFDRVVQFSHFSVKEFLTSDRLASSGADISRFHVLLKPAHTVIAKACLGILLQSDNGVDNIEAKSHSPLAKYAAMHWVDHAQPGVSTHLQVVMRPLFDPAMPYFEAWLYLYDIDQGWDGFSIPRFHEEGIFSRRYAFDDIIAPIRVPHALYAEERGSPLYYASLCGFRDLAAHLIAKHPQHLNARLGRCFSPLAAALHERHFDIAELLYQRGADVGIRGSLYRTLLHAASIGGSVDIAQWLVDHCVDAHLQKETHETPLHLAEASARLGQCKSVDAMDNTSCTPLYLALLHGHLEIVRLLVEYGANVNASRRDYKAPSHLESSESGRYALAIAALTPEMIDDSAVFDADDRSHQTPLHLALSSANPEIVRLLLEHGADVNARDGSHAAPVHLASCLANPKTVRLLLEHGADVDSRDASHRTPLHLALISRSLETMRVLIEHGADVNARDGERHDTPLHLALDSHYVTFTPSRMASTSANPEAVRLLIEHGAGVDSRNVLHVTPLHLASNSPSPETMRVLIEHGADVNARDWNHKTPLHLAYSLQTLQILIEHGADVNARDERHSTPLHMALSSVNPENLLIMRVLIEHGADVNARDRDHRTPLHLAFSLQTLQILIEHGADVNARDGRHSTPLHTASSSANIEIVRLLIMRALIEQGADVNARDRDHKTPLHLAFSSQALQILIEHGADVNARDGRHSTLLHMALSSWRPEMVRLLLKHGADANAQDGCHKTPLHLASYQDERLLVLTEVRHANSKADIVQVLIQHGADVTARDNTRSTPLHLASSKGSGETVKLLLEHGADVNAQDGRYLTPLHLAASSRLAMKGNVVNLLLSHGANVDAKDGRGRTPFQIASSRGLSEITELLSNYQVRGE